MSATSPLPWSADEQNDILDADGNTIALTVWQDDAEGNAALIVKAANAHAELVAMARRLADVRVATNDFRETRDEAEAVLARLES